MGMFGGDGKKKKEEEAAEQQEKRTARRSRRVVTPGSKPAQPGSGSANVRRASRPASGAQPAPEAKRQTKRVSKPAAAQPRPAQPKPPSQAPIDLDAPGGIDLGPSIQPGAGKVPITDSPDLDFSGSLDAGPSSGGRSGDEPLLAFLVGKANLVSEEQAQQARQKAAAEDVPIDVACTRLGFIDEDQLVNALTQECWVPHLKVDKYEIRKKALDTIAENDARRLSVLPVDKLGSILNLAMVNPLDVEAIRVLEGKTGLDIKKVVATRSEIEHGIDKYYGGAAQAKEGSLQIEQEQASQSLDAMMDAMEPSIAPAPAPAAAAPAMIEPAMAPIDPLDEIADIDDLLGGDEAVAPAIVEPISIEMDEIEPEIEPEFADLPEEDIVPVEPKRESGRIQVSLDDDFDQDLGDPMIAPATSAITKPKPEETLEPAVAPAPKPAAAKARVVDLVPVMEEEFQHAISHGKSRLFDKWVSLQTRNRILNAVTVEREIDPVLSTLFANGELVEV